MDLALFGIQKFELFLLVLVRTASIFTLTPIFGSSQAPAHVRVAIALALTMVFVPMVPPPGGLPAEVLPMAVMVVRETCVGLVIGFVCSMVFAAIQIAGQFVDAQSGFSFATLLDPVNGANAAVAGRFQHLVAGLLFFVTNAHHLLIRGLADSFKLAPVGQMAMNPAMASGIMELFSGLFGIAFRIAAPIIAAVFLADVAFAIIARIVPQINVLIIGFPLKLGVGLAAMIIALPFLAAMSQGMFGDMYHEIGGIARLLSVH